MIDVLRGAEQIGSIIKVSPRSRPYFAYTAKDGRGENFKTRKEAIAWLEAQHGERDGAA